MLPSSPLPYWSRANFVVVENRKIIMLRPHRTSAPEQQPSPMKKVIDQKDQACIHSNENVQRLDPTDPLKTRTDRIMRDSMETHLRASFDDARSTIGTRIKHGTSPPPHSPNQDVEFACICSCYTQRSIRKTLTSLNM